MAPNGNLVIADKNGREVGSVWSGYGGLLGVGAQGGGYSVGPYMYGMGSTPWLSRDEPPPPRAMDIRRMLSIDAKAQQVYEALTQSLRSADWQITDGYQAGWVRAVLADLDPPMDVVIAQMASASAYARAMFEVVYDTMPDGRITPTRIAYRPPDNTTLRLDDQGKPIELVQQLSGGEATIPLERTLIYLHNEHRAPGIGISDIEPVWYGHWEKRNIRALWRIFLARSAMPWTIAQADAQHTSSMASFAQRAASLKSGGVLGIGPNEKVTTLDAAANAGAVFMQALEWIDQQATAAVLAQFLDLGQSRVGSFALSRDHSDLFTLGRDAALKEMANALTNQLIERMVQTNWPDAPEDNLPSLRFSPLAEADASQLVTLLGQIMAAGTLPPQIPPAFFDEVVEKVALILGLDVQAIKNSKADPIAAAAAQASQLLGAALPAGGTSAPAPVPPTRTTTPQAPVGSPQ